MNYLLNILIITVSYLIYKIYKKVLPSEGLRNIPTVSFLEYTKRHYFKKDPLQKTLREVFLPIADENGIVKVFDIAIQRWIVFVAKPEYFKEIIYKSDISKINSKNRPMSEFELKYIGHDNMLFLIEEEHRRHRRIANPAFRRGWPTKLFGDLIVKLFKEIDKTVEKNPTFDIVSISQKYTLDALGRAAFNYDFGSISNRMTLILDAYNSVTKAMADTTYIIFPILEKIPGFRRPKLMKKLDLVNKFLGDIVDEKNREIENSLLLDNKNEKQKDSSNNDNKDLLTLMLEAQRNEKGKYVLSKEEIMYDLKLFFLAGHDTTATAISCAVAYMAMHPEYQNKARQEVLSVMNGEELDAVPTSDQIREMKWINMIINETLRLHPPAISLGIRVNRQKLNLGELVIPENTLLLPTIYLQHLSSKLFKDPLKFLPERFDTSNEENNKDPYKFIPFGGGTRICIGMNFSLAEQRVFLAMLLRKYEWTLPDDTIHKNDFIEVHRTYLNLLIPKNLNINFYKRK